MKPGCEEDFVRALRDLAAEARAEVGAEPPTLLRDRDHPNVFLTFGPWHSLDEIERFREFLFPRLGSIRELLEGFEAHTLDEVGFRD